MIIRTLLSLAIIGQLFAFSSCSSTYIYSTIASTNDEIEKTKEGDFYYENDSLWIAYSLQGDYAALLITVYNKLEEPLYIDWKKSLLVYNGIKHSYMRGNIVFIGDQYGNPHINSAIMDQEQMTNTLNTPQHISYIPPSTMVTHQTYELMEDLEKYRKRKMETIILKNEQGKKQKIDGLTFDYSNSPLQITSYINTYYTQPSKEQTYAIDLYMFNVLRTHTQPEKMIENMAKRGDVIIYKRKPSYRFWKNVGKGLAITSIAAATVAVESYLEIDDEN